MNPFDLRTTLLSVMREGSMPIRTYECPFCTTGVSEVAGHVKLGMNKYAHTDCYLRSVSGSLLSEQEKVLSESFQRRESELVTEINRLRTTKGESAVVSKDTNTVVFNTKTWDEAAERICKLAIAHIGPSLPLGTLKRYAWFIYSKLRDEKLIQPLSDDKAEETLSEAQERSKKEVEEWLRKSSK